MNQEDIEYLSQTIGDLAGIPIRIYENGKKTYFHSLLPFSSDPVSPYEERLLSIEESVGYFVTPRFYYFGIVNSSSRKIVLGPSRQVPESEQALKEFAFECDVDPIKKEAFISSMKSLTLMPLSSILQTLCALNFVLNGERKSLAEITIHDDAQGALTDRIEKEESERAYDFQNEERPGTKAVHNTLALEETVMNFILHGDTTSLRQWLNKAPSIRSGIIASEALRQYKNTFIVTATLASRAAIRGGMDVETSLSLSDAYIQKCELLHTLLEIENLQYHMIFDFTERVERLRLGGTPTKLASEVANYTLKHLSEPLNVTALSKSLFISRTYLAAKFKKETGMTLSEFILRQKVEEGKRLLRYTDKPILSIASYLGFSSPGHFASVFRKFAVKSPLEYRKAHNH